MCILRALHTQSVQNWTYFPFYIFISLRFPPCPGLTILFMATGVTFFKSINWACNQDVMISLYLVRAVMECSASWWLPPVCSSDLSSHVTGKRLLWSSEQKQCSPALLQDAEIGTLWMTPPLCFFSFLLITHIKIWNYYLYLLVFMLPDYIPSLECKLHKHRALSCSLLYT